MKAVGQIFLDILRNSSTVYNRRSYGRRRMIGGVLSTAYGRRHEIDDVWSTAYDRRRISTAYDQRHMVDVNTNKN